MGIYGDFQKAKASSGARNRFETGEYLMEIGGVRFGKTRNKLDLFGVEMRVVSYDGPSGKEHQGKPIDWATMSDRDGYFGDVKAFILALYGETEDAIDSMAETDFDALMNGLCGPGQAAAGMHLRVSVREYVSQGKGKSPKGTVMNIPTWVNVPLEEQPEEIQAIFAQVDQAA